MSLCTKDDLKTNIRTYKLNQLVDNDDTVIEAAIHDAESIVIDHLFQHFDTATIFSAIGNNRNSSVLGWIKYIALYKIFERIPDEQVPERIVKNYDDTMEYLGNVSAGKVSLNLPEKIIIDTNGEKKTKFRGGGMNTRQVLR